MDYFIGSVLTLVSVYVMNRLVSKKLNKTNIIPIPQLRQSRYYEMTRYMYPIDPSFKRKIESQATKYFDSRSTRVLFMDGFAWFIKKTNGMNALYVAEMNEEGFDENSAKRVDTMTMDDVELKKTMFIVEKLTEGL